jgi:hypothetical protein
MVVAKRGKRRKSGKKMSYGVAKISACQRQQWRQLAALYRLASRGELAAISAIYYRRWRRWRRHRRSNQHGIAAWRSAAASRHLEKAERREAACRYMKI